jgi:RyR domain
MQELQPRPGARHPSPLAHGRLCHRAVTRLGGKQFHFHRPEIELLAAAEHERWNPERIADGWTLADEKNVEQKQTPYLLPWKQLKKRHPDIAELDAVFIRAMPAILAPAGWEIIRTHEGTVIDSE